MKLSVIIPCYNEKALLPQLIALVKNAPLEDKEIIKGLQIEENGFGIEPGITVKVGKKKCRVYEVGISYYGRS